MLLLLLLLQQQQQQQQLLLVLQLCCSCCIFSVSYFYRPLVQCSECLPQERSTGLAERSLCDGELPCLDLWLPRAHFA
eukprot:SAG11_NODE_17851_length_507_cov_1.019608_1_plen_77_part_01